MWTIYNTPCTIKNMHAQPAKITLREKIEMEENIAELTNDVLYVFGFDGHEDANRSITITLEKMKDSFDKLSRLVNEIEDESFLEHIFFCTRYPCGSTKDDCAFYSKEWDEWLSNESDDDFIVWFRSNYLS